MKFAHIIILFIFISFCSLANASSYHAENNIRDDVADSIMALVIQQAQVYEKQIRESQSVLYLKGNYHILKQNRLINSARILFKRRKGVYDYYSESLNEMHYSYPSYYDYKTISNKGTVPEIWFPDQRLIEHFHINVYAPTLLKKRFIAPVNPNAADYYTYALDSITKSGIHRLYHIHFIPRNKSLQLIDGEMAVEEGSWKIRHYQYIGHSETQSYLNVITMGLEGSETELLPVDCLMELKFNYLKNRVDATYQAHHDYTAIETDKIENFQSRRHKYNLSEYYELRMANRYNLRDTSLIAHRPIPLTTQEEQLFQNYQLALASDTVLANGKKKNQMVRSHGFNRILEMFVTPQVINLGCLGTIKNTPIIDPFKIEYSPSRGIYYRIGFRYTKEFTHDRLITIYPRVGFATLYKEFFWSIKSEFDYLPRYRGKFLSEIGNGNRIEGKTILDEFNERVDSTLFNQSKLNLKYYRDFYVTLTHSIEITNGLKFDVGLALHRRRLSKNLEFELKPGVDASQLGVDLTDLERYKNMYYNFGPHVRLEWTPGMYYFKDRYMKVNLYSLYPTMSVEWERGLDRVFKNSSSYDRFEFDLNHHVPLTRMRTFYYRLGTGFFTNAQNLYFTDFSNLKRANIPEGWEADFGGVFQLLSSRWYHSTMKYFRGNVVFEAPYLLMPHKHNFTKYVMTERAYFNMLFTPYLHPHWEVGYGVGTQAFNFTLFTAFRGTTFHRMGCRFRFELFRIKNIFKL